MAIIKKGNDIDVRYTGVVPVCKALGPVFKVGAYIAGILAALLVVMSVVLVFVDVSAEELLFTPYMSVIEENGERFYEVTLGNGMEVIRAYDKVDTSNIKATVYAWILTCVAGLAVSVPILSNLAKLFKNIGSGRALTKENAAFVNNVGFAVLVGNPIVSLVKRYFNYSLMKNFVDVGLNFDFGIDLFDFFLGLLIILLGTIYGYACVLHKQETALILSENSDLRR